MVYKKVGAIGLHSVVLFSVFLNGCSPALTIPLPVEVNRITVIDQEDILGTQDFKHVSRTIDDPKQIGDLITFLKARNRFWYGEIGTFPVGRFTISFFHNDDHKLVLWFGDQWLGGRDGNEDRRHNCQRHLSKEDTELLKQLLGVE